MNEVDYILEVRRLEERRAQAIFDLVCITFGLVGYGVYRLIAWLA